MKDNIGIEIFYNGDSCKHLLILIFFIPLLALVLGR